MIRSRSGYHVSVINWQFLPIIAILFLFNVRPLLSQKGETCFTKEFIRDITLKVNKYQIDQSWKNIDRNWKRATWYTGVMAFYGVTDDQSLADQAMTWGAKHGWRTGSEWIYPANRLACSQTYLQLYFIKGNEDMIKRTRKHMDDKISDTASAFEQGWDYVDALYVGIPAYMMMTSATDNPRYAEYGHKIFRELTDSLFNDQSGLYYRDLKAKRAISKNGKPVFWSRGNGWAIASIPRIILYLEANDPDVEYYAGLLKKMAASLAATQSPDGLWRSNLTDTVEYPMPETTGTAFFTYALAWGINQGYLERDKYSGVVKKAWQGLVKAVDKAGRINWCQPVARKPGRTEKNHYDEYAAGAFLLAASEIYLMFTE